MNPSGPQSESAKTSTDDRVTIAFPNPRAQPRARVELCTSVLESVEQGIIVWSADGYCEFVNSRYRRLLGHGANYLQEGMHRSVYFEKMVERKEITVDAVDSIEADLDSKRAFHLERELGNGVVIAVYIRPMDAGGHVVSYTDITEVKHNELMLSEAIERAETAEQKAQAALQQERLRREETRCLAELGDWLQCCKSIDELYEIVRQVMTGFFTGSSGQLFIYSNSRDVLDGVVCWGSSALIRNVQPHDCWGLRRGRIFHYGEGVVKYPCSHVVNHNDEKISEYVCLPIIAQGDTVGLLHIGLCPGTNDDSVYKRQIIFAQKCAEQISVAIANVKLRDELHEQSTRDPLTGLYNRRHFIDRCRSAISLVQRDESSLALISFDADNFKSYNDKYGHDAGDYILCTVGSLISRYFDAEETCCRIGGEEFSVLLPAADIKAAQMKAEELVAVIAGHEFSYRGTPLPRVTISAGVASFPGDAETLVELCNVADSAMYLAKEMGKNRVCVAE